MKKILFVCLGNICRSPAAEAVMQHMLKKSKLDDHVYCDSAGTSAHHSGQKADPRMRDHGAKRSYELLSISRKFEVVDFDDFDLIVVMDKMNLKNVLQLAQNEVHQKKVVQMTSFCSNFSDTEVPDPYYGGESGFEHVFDLIEDACLGIIDSLKRNK